MVVFNLNRAKELAREKGLILVEGFLDCFRIWQAGFKNVVALMGSFMSPEQEELIVESVGLNGRVILIFDGDEPGRDCADQVASRLFNHVFVRVVSLEPDSQPDKLSEKEIKNLLG